MSILWGGKRHELSMMKLIGMGIALAFCVGMVLFIHRVYLNYIEIRRQGAQPLWQRQMKASLSHAVANPDVSAQDVARVASSAAPRMGNPSGTLAIVEFLDFDCPYCGASFMPVRELAEKYKDQISLTIRDFPVTELHPRAVPAALAAHCAQEQ